MQLPPREVLLSLPQGRECALACEGQEQVPGHGLRHYLAFKDGIQIFGISVCDDERRNTGRGVLPNTQCPMMKIGRDFAPPEWVEDKPPMNVREEPCLTCKRLCPTCKNVGGKVISYFPAIELR